MVMAERPAPEQADKPRGMKPSPSLMFDILVEDDTEKQLEKYKRGSLDLPRPATDNKATDALQPSANGFHNPNSKALPTASMGVEEVLEELLGDLYIAPSDLKELSLLGEGGFASVRKCMLRDRVLDFKEPVAVKAMKQFTSTADLKEFLLEANLLRKMRHPHIVRLRGVGAWNVSNMTAARGSFYLVEEFMAGGDLKQLLLEQVKDPFRPLYTKADALRWALQLAEAMHYLHNICKPIIIHRDLKLDNLLLTETNTKEAVVKLADFGLHKRVKKLPTGALAPWISDFTSHHNLGPDADRSYYGGNAFSSIHPSDLAQAAANEDAMNKLATANNMTQSDLAILAVTGTHPNPTADPNTEGSVHRKILALKALDAAGADSTAPSPPAAAPATAAAVLADATADGLPAASSGLPTANGDGGGSIKFIEGTQRVGSLLYMAPEVLKGQPYNEKVDVFSYGIILYELLSASNIMVRVCIQGGAEEMAPYARRVSEGHREPMPAYWPEDVKKLVGACWAQDPRLRPGFDDIIRTLHQLQRDDVAAEMERNKPTGMYSPLCDCGCIIM